MRECICCQCAEHSGQFKNYVQCECCQLYGDADDDFSDDLENHTYCNECYKIERINYIKENM